MDQQWENDLLIKQILPKIVKRTEWKAVKPKNKQKLKLPVRQVIFSNTNSRPCYSKEHCIHDLQQYQKERQQGSTNIPFNFLIGKDGNVYEGMGWNYQADSKRPSNKKVKSLKDRQISIAFINDKELQPSLIQTKRAMGLIILGIKNNYVMEKCRILKDENCESLFSISDFSNTMMGILGRDENKENSSEESSAEDTTEEDLLEGRKPYAMYNYSTDDDNDPDELKYYNLKYTIREENPYFM